MERKEHEEYQDLWDECVYAKREGGRSVCGDLEKKEEEEEERMKCYQRKKGQKWEKRKDRILLR